MQGLHLTADLYRCRCDSAWLTDAHQLQQWCLQAVQDAGLRPVNQVFEVIPGTGNEKDGVAGAVLLAESQVSLHTWPGTRAVTADVYVCNANADCSARARALMDALVDRFQPEWTEQRSLDRGGEDA